MKHLKGTALILSVIILPALMCSFNGCTKSVTASLTADKTEAAVGEPIQFFNQSTGKFDSWSWDFGDGSTSTEMNPSHVYKEAGTFYVTLVIFTENDQPFDTLDITVTGSAAGKTPIDVQIKDTPEIMDIPALTINRIEMCSGPIQRDECRPQPGATFQTGDIVAVWFEITGFDVQGKEGTYEVWVQWRRYSLYAPDGRVIMTDSNMHEWHEFPPSVDHIEAFHGWWNVGQVEASDPPGEYTVEIEIGDALSGDVVIETRTFTLK